MVQATQLAFGRIDVPNSGDIACRQSSSGCVAVAFRSWIKQLRGTISFECSHLWGLLIQALGPHLHPHLRLHLTRFYTPSVSVQAISPKIYRGLYETPFVQWGNATWQTLVA